MELKFISTVGQSWWHGTFLFTELLQVLLGDVKVISILGAVASKAAGSVHGHACRCTWELARLAWLVSNNAI